MESLAEYYPDSKWQRCTVHFYRNVFSVVPRKKMPQVAAMLKAIHASEDKQAALEKAGTVFTKLEDLKLKEAAKKVQDSIIETLAYFDFPREHHIRISGQSTRLAWLAPDAVWSVALEVRFHRSGLRASCSLSSRRRAVRRSWPSVPPVRSDFNRFWPFTQSILQALI